MPNYHESVTFLSKPLGIEDAVWDVFAASAVGDLDQVRLSLEDNPEFLHTQIWYEFPLHFAVRGGHENVVRHLLELGCNPARSHFRYSSWQKLLPMANQNGHTLIHDLLVEEMVKRFSYNPDYEKVFAPIDDGDLTLLKDVISRFPDSIHRADENGNRAIHRAVLARRIPVIELLLDAGANIDAKRADLQSPLHLAILGSDYWYRNKNRDPNTSNQDVARFLLRYQ